MIYEMSNDESDLAQARRLLASLQENMIHTTRMIEKFERQRPRGHPQGRESVCCVVNSPKSTGTSTASTNGFPRHGRSAVQVSEANAS